MKHQDASNPLQRTTLTERAAAGFRLLLWTSLLQVALFAALYKLQTALGSAWAAPVHREPDPWLESSIGAIESAFPAITIAFGLSALRLGASLPGRGARRLALTSAGLFAPALVLELAHMVYRRGYLDDDHSPYTHHRVPFQLQMGSMALATLALTVLLAAAVLGVARTRRARVLGAALSAVALTGASSWLALRMLGQALGGHIEPLVASPRLAALIAFGTPAAAGLGVALCAHLASRGVGHEHASEPRSASDPYRDAHRLPGRGGFEPDYELPAQGLARFRSALGLRLILLVLSTVGTLSCIVLRSSDGARELARIVPLGNLALAALMALGLFRYGTVPRRGGARDMAALALLLTLAATLLELESYLGTLPLLDETPYVRTRIGAWSLDTLARREALSQVVSLAAVLVAVQSLAPAARPCGGRDIAPRAWLVSGLLVASGLLALWFRTNALEHRVGRDELVATAGIGLVVAVVALVLLLAVTRDAQQALERGAAPRVGVPPH